MAVVKKATREMIPNIVDLLLDFNNPLVTRQDWQNMLLGELIPREESEPSSLVLVDEADNGKIVGFIGLVYSTRQINGKTRHFGNLTSWIVKKRYRLESLKLLNAALRLKTHTLTNFSPTEDVHKICLRLKFKELENSFYLLSPLTNPQASLSRPWLWTTGDKNKIEARLSGADLQIFSDHRDTSCGKHLLLYNDDAYCYIVSSIRYIRDIPCSWIHYLSHPDVFFSHQAKVKWGLLKTNRTIVTLLDSRFVGSRSLPFAVKRNLRPSRLYRPAEEDLSPEMVDSLYSEYMWVTPP